MNYPRETLDPNRYQADPNEDPAAPFRNLDPAPRTSPTMVIEPRADDWVDPALSIAPTSEEVVERQRERFGGLKVGSAFFGWLIAMGVAAIVIGVAAVAGVALGLDVIQSPRALARDIPLDADTVGWISIGALLALLLGAFMCGGYVAGRMARFSGIVQGLAVWVWALVIAIVVVLAGVVLGGRYDLVGYLDAFPRIPVPEDLLMIAIIVAAVVAVAVSLGGAILGGHTGVRYHRKVDRVGFEA
ncbi:hypothetical protein LQ757_08980 [Agromyces sp. SYSU K20354]|uniref:hypothetical protein n=1 Tax=Agromyces cavernae TaxID=2898659 RepID=UPI001E33E8F2|nr:hypothetical protein [Agromyces cavernae]MCD2442405.1 hypothetical protein [Agromyces cavernae]